MTIAWRFQKPLQSTCRVLFAGPHFQAALPYTRDLIQQRKLKKVELVHAPTTEALLAQAPNATVAIPFMEKFQADFIERATGLRLIIQFGVGLEGVDMETATRNGIAVSNIPANETGNAEATAEHGIFLTLSLLRRTMDQLPRRFQNRELGGLPIPKTLFGKKVTVVGYGAVGSTLCQYLMAMGAHVTAVRRQWPGDEITPPLLQRSTDLDSVLPTTDVLILACTMTPETYHLLDYERLHVCKRGILVVNVGRGPLVCHEAILEALESNHVEAFASDVGVGHDHKPSEPWDPLDELSQQPRALFTPHVGGYTDFTYSNMAEHVVDAISNIVDGREPKVWVNKDQSI